MVSTCATIWQVAELETSEVLEREQVPVSAATGETSDGNVISSFPVVGIA